MLHRASDREMSKLLEMALRTCLCVDKTSLLRFRSMAMLLLEAVSSEKSGMCMSVPVCRLGSLLSLFRWPHFACSFLSQLSFSFNLYLAIIQILLELLMLIAVKFL